MDPLNMSRADYSFCRDILYVGFLGLSVPELVPKPVLDPSGAGASFL